MKISVWDTYVPKADGCMMHFDILVPHSVQDREQVLGFGKEYLKSKNLDLSIKKTGHCNFCHVEHPSIEVLTAIEKHGFAIVELESCD